MINYYKYLKYKQKYLNLKGGYALSQECNFPPYNILNETDDLENETDFFYPKIKSYFKTYEETLNYHLKNINDFSKDKTKNKTDIDSIIEFFNKKEHKDFLEDLLKNYMKDDFNNYHVQFSALIFISFIIELELFMILYSIVPYNTNENKDNNDMYSNWISIGRVKPIYKLYLKDDIIEVFKEFTCALEHKYKIFIEAFTKEINSSRNEEDIKKFNDIFYKKDYNYDYRHIKRDWMEKLENKLNISKSNIIIKLNNILKVKFTSLFYDPTPLGLFDYVFYGEDKGSCITFSLLEFYFLSRLHIKYEDLSLELESGKDISPHYITFEENTNSVCSHWTCNILKVPTRQKHKVYRSFTLKNKAEILFSFIFVVYDKYIFYNKYFINNILLTDFINERQDFLKKILFTSKDIIIASMKINPTNTWKYIDDKLKEVPEIIGEAIRYNIKQFYVLYFDDEEKYKKKEYILKALESKQLKYTDIQNRYLLEDEDLIIWDIINNNTKHIITKSIFIKLLKIKYNVKLIIDDSIKLRDKDVIFSVVGKTGLVLQYASDILRDKDVILSVVEKNGLALQYASDILKDDREVVFKAVKENPLALQYASDILRDDREVVLKAVKNNGLALEYASDNLRKTFEIIAEAVKNNILSLKYRNISLQLEKSYMQYVVSKNGLFLEYVKGTTEDAYKEDETFVMAAITNNPLALQYASDDLKDDRDIVKSAIKDNFLALQYASDDLKNDITFIKEIVGDSGLALIYVDKKYIKDREIVKIAVSNYGSILEYVDDKFKDDNEIVKLAVQNDGLALRYASSNLKNDKEIVKLAVENNILSIQYANEIQIDNILLDDQEIKNNNKIKNNKIWIYIIKKYNNDKNFILNIIKDKPFALIYASDIVKQDSEIISKLVEIITTKDSLALQYASDELKNNFDIVKLAVGDNGLALQYAGDELKNNFDIVKAAIENNPSALQYASNELKNNFDIVKLSVGNNGLALQYASDELKNNFYIVKLAVGDNGLALQYASNELKNNLYIVKTAVENNTGAIDYSNLRLII